MSCTNLGVTFVSLFAMVTLVSGNIPGAPTNLNVTGFGSRTINISWVRPSEDGNSTQLNYTVFYKVKGENVLREVEMGNVTKATLAVKPYTNYEMFVMASNQNGYGPPLVRKFRKTLEEAPERCPNLNVPEERHNDTTIMLIWEDISKQDRNGVIKGYVIFYKSRDMSECKNITVLVPADKQDLESYYIHNVPKEENYGFRVAAFTSQGLCKGYNSIPLKYEPQTKTTAAPTTQVVPTTTTPVVPTTTTPVVPTTTPVVPTTTTPVVPTTTPVVPTRELLETTTKPSEPSALPSTSKSGCTTEAPATGETGASTKDSSWLVYILIALAAIVAIMGVTIFLLIWQLYRNHRTYKLREQEQYRMNITPTMDTDNMAQDNAV